ncbi:rhodanese domain-containing protein CG4456-like [Epargyreus clarus]|uniref:rhodanese domain-containing protein CG4456-like n=1 Tax=Epargyreus clarus TaxID=520877 RepID=UPI003C2FF9F8
MFGRLVYKNISPALYQAAKSCASLQSNTVCRNVIVNSVITRDVHCKAPNVSHVPCRFYSKEATLEDMVVDFQEVKKATSDGKVLIVDVREPEEVKEHGKIPNSINIPLGTVSSALSTMPDAEFERTFQRPKPTEDTEIIFYCMIGKRSGMAQQNAFNLGYKNVKNYLGSWTDWANKTQ